MSRTSSTSKPPAPSVPFAAQQRSSGNAAVALQVFVCYFPKRTHGSTQRGAYGIARSHARRVFVFSCVRPEGFVVEQGL